MKIFTAFPSKYLRACDLHDKHVTAVMSHVLLEEIANKDGSKELLPILYFRGVPKGMVLNKTNARVISELYDDETDAWIGMPIVLFPAMVAFGAETVEAIRVKPPSAASRIRAAQDSPHQEMLTVRMHEQFAARPMFADSIRPTAATEDDLARAREAFAAKKTPTPRPVPIESVMVLDEAGEREPTATERTELLTEQLRQSVALEESRKTANGDGLDIPAYLRRAKPEPTVADFYPLG
jgi:hypothetical protein